MPRSVSWNAVRGLFLPDEDPGACSPPVTATVNPAAVAGGASLDVDVTVAGAAVGMGVLAQPPALTAGLVISYVRVKAANTVTVRLYNSTLVAIDEPSATWSFWLARP